jgi:hypothetical protein
LLFLFFYNISLLGIGGQMFFGIILLVFIYLMSKKYLKYFTLLFLLFTFFIISTSGILNLLIENKKNDILLNKFNSAVELVEFSSKLEIEEIPWSPKVRIIELINLFDQNPIQIIFGNGLGGYITETKYKFGFVKSNNPDDDFSEDQISTGRYYKLHNIGMIILKFGLIFYLLMLLILYKILKYSKDSLEKSLLLAFWVTEFFNFGWTFRISIPFVLLLHFYIKNIDLSIIKQINKYFFSNYIRKEYVN